MEGSGKIRIAGSMQPGGVASGLGCCGDFEGSGFRVQGLGFRV